MAGKRVAPAWLQQRPEDIDMPTIWQWAFAYDSDEERLRRLLVLDAWQRVLEDGRRSLDQLLAIVVDDGADDRLAQNARLVEAGAANAWTMTWQEAFDFTHEPDLRDIEADEDRLRRVVGSKTFDLDYRQAFMAAWRRQEQRQDALVDLLLQASRMTPVELYMRE